MEQMGAEVNQVGERIKVMVALKRVYKGRSLSVRVKMGVFDGIVVPLVLCRCKPWGLCTKERKRVDMMEMKS